MSIPHPKSDLAGRAHQFNGAPSMNANDAVPRASGGEKQQMSTFDGEGTASPARPRPERRRWRKGATLALVSALGVALITGTPAFISSAGAQAAGTAKAEGPATSASTIDVAAVAAATDPAVVDVNTVLDGLEGGGAAAGTGMVVSPNGVIVTNNHVVQGADTVTVVVPGHGSHNASVIGTGPSADVAVLKVAGLSGLPTVKFGGSSTVIVGEPVVAIGNALGLGGSPTVTQGIISATGRMITASDGTGAGPETLYGLLQTDAPIAPGNSGGPLVDAADQVIGMDTAGASAGATGASLGFAIPSATVLTVADQIEAHQSRPGLVYGRQAFLGVDVVDSSPAGGASFGPGPGVGPVASTPNRTAGVVVAGLDPDSPAARAGIGSGDVITAVNGQATATTAALSNVIEAKKPGQIVSLTVSTEAGTEAIPVRLAPAPVDFQLSVQL
jgi:S1-C subfamily serine protease